MSNLSAPLPVMAGEDMPAGPTDPIFNRLLKDRIIWMGEEVKDEMANRICAQMLMLAAEDPKKDIWLYINSPGGSITLTASCIISQQRGFVSLQFMARQADRIWLILDSQTSFLRVKLSRFSITEIANEISHTLMI